MKFAVLNVDADALSLARALIASDGHAISVICGGEPAQVAALRSLAPSARLRDVWEGVLADGTQAVVVGGAGSSDEHFEQLRRLAQEGVAAVVVHPFGIQPLEYHELDMNRQATGAASVAYEPTRYHPAVVKLREVLHSYEGEPGPLGRVAQIVVERQASDRSRQAILRRFVRDIGTARLLGGECQKVSALGLLPLDGTPGHLGVQVTTAEGVLIRWSIGPVVDRGGAELTVVGDRGRYVVEMPDVGPWSSELRAGDLVETETFADAEPAQEAAACVVSAIADRDLSSWRAALREMEIVEAVERSLHKGRTVELFHEEASEHGTFKGVMAAGGCLLITLSIGLAIVATIVGRFRFPLANLWPYALLALLGAFLLLQLLKLVFPREE